MFAQTLPPAKFVSNNLAFKDQPTLAFPSKSEVAFVKKVCTLGITSRRSCNSSVVRCVGSEAVREQKLDDGYYIRRCVELARKGLGFTSPNPMVGCVIVKDGKIVGEGFHPKPGQPHAEVFALRNAGELAENATAYVSLEPCNHYGRTPPCTEALIKAKVANVVVGMVDPNPIVASTGIKKLQEAGIKVTVGVEEEMCKSLIEAYTHRMLTGRAFLTLRYSISLNGHIVNQLGEEAMEQGGYYSKLLQEYDVVILSTSLVEKSSLPISKEVGANQPHLVVLSKSPNHLTPHVHGIASKLTMITDKDSISEPQTSSEGFDILCLDRITLPDILQHLATLGACSVLLDLRGNVSEFESILEEGLGQNLFQKVIVEALPVFGGGDERVSKYLETKVKMKSLTQRVSGNSVVLEGYF